MRYLKRIGVFFALLWQVVPIKAQNPERPEIDLENFAINLFGQPSSDVNYEEVYENLYQYYRQPMDLNKATRADLEQLFVLNPAQINALLAYRNTNGKFLSLYELQAIPEINRQTFERLLPFVIVVDEGFSKDARGFLRRMQDEENHYLISRLRTSPELQKGFRVSDTLPSQAFLGSNYQLYHRYRLYQKNDFSVSFVADKDVGEPFGWYPERKIYGYDFYSGHVAIFNKGKVKKWVVGDYQMLLGQGLVQSAGFFLGKGAETVAAVKRSNQGIRPYSGALEANFLRGTAVTLAHKQFESTSFVSYRLLDGNVQTANDSLVDAALLATSIYQTGLHRTQVEINRKQTIEERIAGQYVVYKGKHDAWHIGLYGVYYQYDPPFVRGQRLYNAQDFRGSNTYNLGIDYQFIWQNAQFFGEISHSANGGQAQVHGVMASLHPKLDASMVFRNYAVDFNSFYGNPFGESSLPKNERGIYWGLKYMPNKRWTVSGFYDIFYRPWLSFAADAPALGLEYLGKVTYQPSRKTQIFLLARIESKEINTRNNLTSTDYLTPALRYSYILNMDYTLVEPFSMRTRVQLSDFRQRPGTFSHGLAVVQDITYSFHKKLKVSARTALFDTDDFDSRIYLFEKNVLYAFAIPVFYGTGMRNYVLLQYKIRKFGDVWLRYARTTYYGQANSGSGVQEIDGRYRTEITLQVKVNLHR